MRCVLVAILLWGCQQPEGSREATDGPPPAERVQTLRLELHAAQQAWSEGRVQEARARARQSYREQFEPLEEALRALDPVATLELEYAFGALDRQLSKRGKALAVAEVVQQITRETDRLVARLPQPEGAVGEPAPTAGVPKAEAANLPPHLRSEG